MGLLYLMGIIKVFFLINQRKNRNLHIPSLFLFPSNSDEEEIPNVYSGTIH